MYTKETPLIPLKCASPKLLQNVKLKGLLKINYSHHNSQLSCFQIKNYDIQYYLYHKNKIKAVIIISYIKNKLIVKLKGC